MDKKKRQAIAKGQRMAATGTTGKALPPLPRMPGQKSKGKGKAMRPCACGGCGKSTKTTWFPGHDAICKSWALRVHRDICKIGEVPAEHREGAKRLLPTLKDVSKIAPKTALKLASRGKADGKKAKGGPKKVKKAAKVKPIKKTAAPKKRTARKLPGSQPEAQTEPVVEQPEVETAAESVVNDPVINGPGDTGEAQ